MTLFAFVAITMVSQLESVARFATLGAGYSIISLFGLYQIMFILPNIIPIACLIAATVLYRQLSSTQVLTALRGGGLSLSKIMMPILAAGVFLFLVTFFITSELSTQSHFASRNMLRSYAANNPIMMLKSSAALKNQRAYINMQTKLGGESAQDIVLITNNPQNSLTYMAVKNLSIEQDNLKGDQMNVIAPVSSEEEESFDNISTENVENFTMPLEELIEMNKTTGFRVSNDYLHLRLLLVYIQNLKQQLRDAGDNFRSIRDDLDAAWSEVARRISIALATFTFILLGICYGIEINRRRSIKNIMTLTILAVLTITSFLVAKMHAKNLVLTMLFYFVPHLVIIALSTFKIKKIESGIK